jgi:uncharacterized repeat protein (TIGR04138 family)
MAEGPDLRLVAADHGRFDVEGYCFISESLRHAAALAGGRRVPGERRHLTAQQLVDGVIGLAAERFGLLAEIVLRRWGIRSSDDVGLITFTLIEQGVFSKQPSDRLEDFYGLPEFASALHERVAARLAKPR